MLAAPPVTLEWVTGRMTVIEATHYVPEMSELEHDAWVRSYFEAVADLPAPFTAEAFDHVSRTIPRKPTPADIRNRALMMLGEARQRGRLDVPKEAPEPKPEISDETREMVNRFLAERGAAPRRREPLGAADKGNWKKAKARVAP